MKSFYVFESEDGKFSRRAEIGRGSVLAVQEEVLAYEESQKDPLAKLMLPWQCKGGIQRGASGEFIGWTPELKEVLTDAMNLLPLLREWRDRLTANDPKWITYSFREKTESFTMQKLILAYEEIEKKAKEL